jgi:hypothetical protein
MARLAIDRDLTPVLSAAPDWIERCLIKDDAILLNSLSLWTPQLIDEVYRSFVEHPDFSGDNFHDEAEAADATGISRCQTTRR